MPQSLTGNPPARAHRLVALIAWLRSLWGRCNSVRITWKAPDHLTPTHRDYDTVGATLQVRVTTEGQPPAIDFHWRHLADSIEIGPTLRLVDKLNPGMTTSLSGDFCALMSLRFTEETKLEDAACETPTPDIAA